MLPEDMFIDLSGMSWARFYITTGQIHVRYKHFWPVIWQWFPWSIKETIAETYNNHPFLLDGSTRKTMLYIWLSPVGSTSNYARHNRTKWCELGPKQEKKKNGLRWDQKWPSTDYFMYLCFYSASLKWKHDYFLGSMLRGLNINRH